MVMSDHTTVVPAGTLMGVAVKDSTGKSLGVIHELVVDLFTGQVAYVLIAVGGFLGFGSRLFVVPWQALQADIAGHYSLPIDAEQFKSSPAFERDQVPDLADQGWGKAVHAFYGLRPYWVLNHRY